MDNCCCVELKVTEDPIIALDIKEQFISGGEITPTGTKEISVTQNGTTNTNVTYYANAKVVANVPNTYAAADEGKVVQDGDLEAQTTATFQTNDTYDTTTIKQVTVDVPASAVDSGYVYINENDTHDVTGYAQAVVDVPNTYTEYDEGKVVDDGELVAQGSATYTLNSTYDTTLISSVTVNVSGGGTPTLQTKSVSYTPTESQQTEQVTADQGYDALQEVDVTVGAVSSTYVGSGITRRDGDDLTASGATVSVPAGYYESSASKAVASGTAGTPSATKGAVSNHSIAVTPSVTNSAGYIASETKTGTAVTVSASELDSGTKNISANGNNQDVVGYAAVNVNVPNTYSAGDEGKVVSNGALVSQGSDTVTVNDTYDTTLISSLTVAVSGGGGDLGGLANMVDVTNQNYQFAYMLSAMKNGQTKGGTVTYTTAFSNSEQLLVATGLTTVHGFMFIPTDIDNNVNDGSSQSNKWVIVLRNTSDTYNIFGMQSQMTGGTVASALGTPGTAQNASPTHGTLRFDGGDIYYTGRYNMNANYQILTVNRQYEWLAW